MSDQSSDDRHVIPESLKRQLEVFRKQLWRRKVMESIAMGLIGLFFSYLLIFGLDRVWQTPGWARLLILVGGASLFVGVAPYWLHRWVWGHRHDGQLARLIAKKFPGLGDRLLGVIELQKQHESGDTLSPRLRAAAMEVVAAEAKRRELDTALPAERHRKWGLAALALMLLVGTAFVLTPKAGMNALVRWLKPFSEVERYTFTQLERPVRYLAVPYGEAFKVSLKLSKDSEQKPQVAYGQVESQPEITAQVRKNRYDFVFPGQQSTGTITFVIGDLKHRLKIEPMQRPVVTRTMVTVKSPDYMRIPERTVELKIGEISAVEGSELQFRLETSRPIASGTYGPTEISGEMIQSENFKSTKGDLKISGISSSLDPLVVGNLPFSLPFSWIDEFGLKGGDNFKIRIDAVRDAPPVAYTQGIDRQKAILPEEVLDFDILCEDDFGLKNTGIEWSSMGSLPGEASAEKGEILIAKGGPEKKRINEPASFSPAAFGIGPQRLLLRAFAEDYYPDRGRVYSEPIMIYVLSREDHAQLLKNQFDRAISEMEDLARKELNLLDENQRLERLDGEELQTEEGKQKLAEQDLAEADNIKRMEELTKRMEELMKDTTRNGDIDKETLKKMAGALKSMQELSEKDMPDVRKELQAAEQPSNTPEKSKQDVESAVAEQKEVIEKMKKALAQARDANKRFEASTFVSRLKKAAGEENEIASSLISKFSELLGARTPEVDPKDQRELTDLTKQQIVTAADVRWIEEDLGHYHARTGEAAFKDIVDQMRDSKIDLGMEKIRSDLQKNHSFHATEGAKQWAEKLAEWAAILDGELNKDGGQGGGGGGTGPDPEDEDFEFMLRVMKMIQQQQDLRSRTRVLEQLKRDASASVE